MNKFGTLTEFPMGIVRKARKLNIKDTRGTRNFGSLKQPTSSVAKIGGKMNKMMLVILLFMTSACGITKHWEPLVDLKGSLSGENFQEDKIMCRAIIKDETSLLYGAWYDRELMQNCMGGRGYSILNKW